jgi:hypothetical protein
MLFIPSPPPQGDVAASDVVAWASENFERLAMFLRQPEVMILVLTQFEAANWAEFKPENGMLVYVNANVLGPQEGVYIYEESAWKKL